MGNTNKRTSASTSEGPWLIVDRSPSHRSGRQRPRSQEVAPKQPEEQQPQVESQQQPEEQQPQVESQQQPEEQQPQVESHLQPEEQQPKEAQEKSSTAEEEGAVAFLLESGKEEKLQEEEKTSPSQREERAELTVVDPALLAEISGFVYHEPDLVLHIRKTLGELQAIAKTIDSTKKNIRESTDDLVVTYNKTTNLFRQRGPDDETVEKAISKLEENVNLQDAVTEGFLSAADGIHSSVLKLGNQIDRMTSVVFAKIPESMLLPDYPSPDTP